MLSFYTLVLQLKPLNITKLKKLFAFFKKNKELLELVKGQVDDRLALMDKDGGQDKVSQFLNDYANDLSAKLEEQLQKRLKIDSTLQQQVEAEIDAIETYLDHLDRL